MSVQGVQNEGLKRTQRTKRTGKKTVASRKTLCMAGVQNVRTWCPKWFGVVSDGGLVRDPKWRVMLRHNRVRKTSRRARALHRKAVCTRAVQNEGGRCPKCPDGSRSNVDWKVKVF